MTVAGHLVKFWNIDSLPRKAKKVSHIAKNDHTFFTCGTLLFMESCAGHPFIVVGLGRIKLSSLTFEQISDDFEYACKQEEIIQLKEKGFVTVALSSTDMQKILAKELGS